MADEDSAQPFPDDGPMPTREEAQAELAQIDAWLRDLATRQAQREGVMARAGFLNGLLRQPAPTPNRAQRRAKPRKAPAKPATKRSR